MGGFFWGIFNVMVKVVGIVKINNFVYRDKWDNGYCVCLEMYIESVKVLGMVNIIVLVVGFIYLGDMLELIIGIKNVEKNMNWGVFFI